MPGVSISPAIRAQIVILREEGYTYREIAARLRISINTVGRSLKLYRDSGTLSFHKRTGRPRMTTARMDQSIIRAVKKSPFASSTTVQAQLPTTSTRTPSTRTIRRRLLAAGLRAYRPATKPRLSKKNIKDRLAFCKAYKEWTIDQWRRVMFSDESTLTQHTTFARHVRRPPGKRFHQSYTIPTVKGAPKIMVWGAIASSGRCGLWFMPSGTTIKGATYLGILQEKLPRYMQSRGCDYFQHDGAPVHQTKAAKKWLGDEGFQILGPWPGNSPDLNPIENCWTILKQRVAQKAPTSSKTLIDAIKLVWATEISPELTAKLVESMPHRIAAVLAAKGKHTKY